MLLAILMVAPLLAWLYLALFHGRFWSTQFPGPPVPSRPVKVIAVIPARDEADTIGQTVTGVLSQRGFEDLILILVDDQSTDGTAEAARQAARAIHAEGRLQIISGATLPDGWTGKVWAMQQGMAVASAWRPDYVWLTDADITHGPQTVETLVGRAEEGPFDLVSYMVRLRCDSWAERLYIPAFVYFFFQLYPPQWIAGAGRSTAGAAGGCVMLRPEALERAGGFAAIRNAIIDDCSLAAIMKQAGGRLWLQLAPDSESIRPYDSWRDIWKMIARSAYTQLRYSPWLLVGSLGGLGLLYGVPWAILAVALWDASGVPCVFVLMTVSLMYATYAPMMRWYRQPWWMVLTLPAAAAFYAAATVDSARLYYAGKGGQWKGRVQAPH